MTNKTHERGKGDDPNAALERAAALAALAVPAQPPATPCPPPEEIQTWHERQLERDEAERIEAHVARCDACFAVWTGLLELSETRASASPAGAAPARRHWLFRPVVAFASVAAVALVGLFLLPQLSPGPSEALPGYDFRLSGSVTFRGDEPPVDDQAIRLVAGDRFELVLVPRTAVAGEVVARAFLATADGGITALRAPPHEDLGKGVVRIVGSVGADVILPEGASTLLIAVGRPRALPDGVTLQRLLAPETSVTKTDWSGWRVPLIVQNHP